MPQESASGGDEPNHYKIFSPSVLWDDAGRQDEKLPDDGGKARPHKDEIVFAAKNGAISPSSDPQLALFPKD